ncbi:hypothetical protein [Streptomyces specialis]|uniref:hypothetical protein n=1 Tax=Streptomyces specialis TaxID=498367 RepID=UPI001F1E6FC2|nr:hypothetical protein [Streptomyces specialis]
MPLGHGGGEHPSRVGEQAGAAHGRQHRPDLRPAAGVRGPGVVAAGRVVEADGELPPEPGQGEVG